MAASRPQDVQKHPSIRLGKLGEVRLECIVDAGVDVLDAHLDAFCVIIRVGLGDSDDLDVIGIVESLQPQSYTMLEQM